LDCSYSCALVSLTYILLSGGQVGGGRRLASNRLNDYQASALLRISFFFSSSSS
jgi:hypothetical protein